MKNAHKETLQESVAAQRQELKELLRSPLHEVAVACRSVWGDRKAMNLVLRDSLVAVPHVEYLYATDTTGQQITDDVGHEGMLEDGFGRDRSQRPYMRERVPAEGFLLSQAYISLRNRRPALTAIQLVRNATGQVLGFVGADFFLHDLPLTHALYEEPRVWKQLKGDPSIRGGVFYQTRVESEMDRHIDTVLGIVEELMTDHGVYHVMLHFSSSRAVVWVYDDPYRYRLLDIDALIDPSICLAYPQQSYPEGTLVPKEQVRAVLDRLRELRFMDETLYLRTGTLNLFNGTVGLTFSCDGSHYVPFDDFLGMDAMFWAA